MKLTYDRVVATAVVLAFIVIVTWLFVRQPSDFLAMDYLPAETEIVVSMTVDPTITGQPDVLASVRQQLNSQISAWVTVLGKDIDKIYWAYDSAGREYVIIQVSANLSRKEKLKLDTVVWPELPVTHNQPVITQLDPRWLLLSSHNYEKPEQSLSDYAKLIDESGVSIYLKKAESLSYLSDTNIDQSIIKNITSLNYPVEINWQRSEEMTRLTVLETKKSEYLATMSAKPLAGADIYLLTTPEMISWLQSWAPMEEFWQRTLPLDYTVSLDDIGKVQNQLELVVANDRWRLAGNDSDIRQLVSSLSFGFGWKQKVGKLPDGSPYREIIRNSLAATSSQWKGRPLDHWIGQERDLYYLTGTSTPSYITNSLDILAFDAESAPDFALVTVCADSQVSNGGVIWLKNGLTSGFWSGETEKIKELAMVEVQQGESRGFSLCFR